MKIYNYKTLVPDFILTKEWLLIGIFTGQRISDLFNFNMDRVFKTDAGYDLRLYQDKTNTPVDIPLNPIVIEILKKYNWEFPPKMNRTSKESFTIKYNKLAKDLLKEIGITRKVTKVKRTKKGMPNIYGNNPINEVYSSHDNRRTFATYYEGKLNRSLIMKVTGHKTEQSYLRYTGAVEINKTEIRRVQEEIFKKFKEPKIAN